uniref:L1 transposable element RRM domain-containing protein n=1 Tax=Poecilia formosa TaxID=48698 RepID=A0A087XKH7_POEFO
EKGKQHKLTDYHLRGEMQKANANSCSAPMVAGDREENSKSQSSKVDEILSVNSIQKDFSSRFDEVLGSIDSVRKEINDCTQRITETEAGISDAESEIETLRAKVDTLESKKKDSEDKVMDLEARSRQNNQRLVNLPEGAEGQNPCEFLEKWLLETLGVGAVAVQRVNRIGPWRDSTTAPHTLIMRFLSYKDKQLIARSRANTDIRYQNQQVRFYPDTVAGLLQLRKQFDLIRTELRKLGLRHGVAHPAKLLVTYQDRTHAFKIAVAAYVHVLMGNMELQGPTTFKEGQT